MANPTYKLIASQVVGSGGVSSITFSSIPQTYTDLKLVTSVRDSRTTGGAASQMLLTINVSPTINFLLIDAGSPFGSPYSATASAINIPIDGSNNTSSTFGNAEIYFPNYTSSNYKSISADAVAENNTGTGDYLPKIQLIAGLFQTTTAISAITLTPYASPFVQYSTFYLYGIKNS
jgi:hypothetical protein